MVPVKLYKTVDVILRWKGDPFSENDTEFDFRHWVWSKDTEFEF